MTTRSTLDAHTGPRAHRAIPQNCTPPKPQRLIFGAFANIVTAVAGLGGIIVRTSIHLCALLAVLLPATWAMAQGEPQPQPPVSYAFADLPGLPEAVVIGGVEHTDFLVYPSGIISFGERLPAGWAEEPRPLAPGMRQIVAPLWSPMGGLCERDADPMGRALNSVTVTADADGILVQWQDMTRLHEACHDEPETSSFSAHMSWIAVPVGPGELMDEVEVFRVVFDYTQDDDGLSPMGEPRAGVVLGLTAIELLPDEGKPRTDRARSLVHGGSGDRADPEVAAAAQPGIWIIEIDADGALFGDDGDGLRTGDNCPHDANLDQLDADGDGQGDVCDIDDDDDTVPDIVDNCVWTDNPGQLDTDGDAWGDACDKDDDGDRVPDRLDNCALIPNPGQYDQDWDREGDACDPDPDGDGVLTAGMPRDLCPWVPTASQRDKDGDGIGDPCDLVRVSARLVADVEAELDSDSDGIADRLDLCPHHQDPWQTDRDGDGLGDMCDPDLDGDGRLDVFQGRCFSSADGVRGHCGWVDWGRIVHDNVVFQ